MADDIPQPDRRKSGQPRLRVGGRRVSDLYMTIPEIAIELGLSERTIRRKFLRPEDGSPPLLTHYDYDGTIRVPVDEFEAFRARYFRPKPSDAA